MFCHASWPPLGIWSAFYMRSLYLLIGQILFCAYATLAAPARPNFILFIADDMAWEDCGTCGNRAVRTPN